MQYTLADMESIKLNEKYDFFPYVESLFRHEYVSSYEIANFGVQDRMII